MATKMDPVLIRRKITEVEQEIASLQRQNGDARLIYIAQRKLSVLKKWLSETEG